MRKRILPVWHYTDAFKEQIVRLVVDHGCPVDAVSEQLGVSRKSIYLWKERYEKDPQHEEMRQENLRLKAELNQVTEERDMLLQKAVGDCLSMCGKKTP